MNLRLGAFLAVATAAVLLSVAGARAQEEPSPLPQPSDTHAFSDLGMDYVAPPEAVLLGRRPMYAGQLAEDLAPVAFWAIYPGKPEMRAIKIEMESFANSPSSWEGQFESQMHNAADGVLFKKKTPITLTNGMPATFVEISFGSGFDAKKEFAVVFADGERGIAISETGRVGEISAEEAQRVLANAKAVRYPSDRDPTLGRPQ